MEIIAAYPFFALHIILQDMRKNTSSSAASLHVKYRMDGFHTSSKKDQKLMDNKIQTSDTEMSKQKKEKNYLDGYKTGSFFRTSIIRNKIHKELHFYSSSFSFYQSFQQLFLVM